MSENLARTINDRNACQPFQGPKSVFPKPPLCLQHGEHRNQVCHCLPECGSNGAQGFVGGIGQPDLAQDKAHSTSHSELGQKPAACVPILPFRTWCREVMPKHGQTMALQTMKICSKTKQSQQEENCTPLVVSIGVAMEPDSLARQIAMNQQLV